MLFSSLGSALRFARVLATGLVFFGGMMNSCRPVFLWRNNGVARMDERLGCEDERSLLFYNIGDEICLTITSLNHILHRRYNVMRNAEEWPQDMGNCITNA